MNSKYLPEVIDNLKEFTTESRWHKIQEVISNRTRYLTVVVEDLYQSHNASAVLRSCEGFGIQDVHVIENRNEFDLSNQVTIGADQWLSLYRYNKSGQDNTSKCILELKKKGFKVIATSPHEQDMSLNDLPIDQKTALIFGSELNGISKQAEELSDGFIHIPMWGFSESFNISVSAAICLHNIIRRLRDSKVEWKLSTVEQQILQIEWLKRSIKAGDLLEKKFLETLSKAKGESDL